MQKEQEQELITETPPDWSVITIFKKQTKLEISKKQPKEISRHELLFQGKMHAHKKGQGGLDTLREMARFMNSRGMVPKPKVECLADVGLAPLPKSTGGEIEAIQ